MIEIVPTLPVHLRALARDLRVEDRAEVSCFGVSPMKALWISWRASTYCRAALTEDRVAAVWGVTGDYISNVGSVWMLTGSAIERIKITFLREARAEVAKLTAFYPTLLGQVSRDYTRAIRLVEALGFEIQPGNEQILQFELRR